MNKRYYFEPISRLLVFSSILLSSSLAIAQQYNNPKYGAIAISNSTFRYGFSWQASTRQEAASLATEYCGAADCKYMTLDAENSYGALAESSDGLWKSSGKTQEEAVNSSLNQCQQSSNTPNICQVILISNTHAVIHQVTATTAPTYSNNDDALLLQQQQQQQQDEHYREQGQYRQQQQQQQQQQNEYYRQQEQQRQEAYYREQQRQQEEYNRRLQLEQSNPHNNGTW